MNNDLFNDEKILVKVSVLKSYIEKAMLNNDYEFLSNLKKCKDQNSVYHYIKHIDIDLIKSTLIEKQNFEMLLFIKEKYKIIQNEDFFFNNFEHFENFLIYVLKNFDPEAFNKIFKMTTTNYISTVLSFIIKKNIQDSSLPDKCFQLLNKIADAKHTNEDIITFYITLSQHLINLNFKVNLLDDFSKIWHKIEKFYSFNNSLKLMRNIYGKYNYKDYDDFFYVIMSFQKNYFLNEENMYNHLSFIREKPCYLKLKEHQNLLNTISNNNQNINKNKIKL